MEKKHFVFLIVIAVLMSFVVGCGAGQNTPATNSSDTTSTTKWTNPILTTETDATIPGGETITYTEFKEFTNEQKIEIIQKFEDEEAFETWFEEIKEDHKNYIENTKPIQTIIPNTNPYQNTNSSTDPSEGATPGATTEASTDTSESNSTIFPTPSDVTVPDKDEIGFMDYHEMSADEQLAFINSFNSPADFAAWHAAARDAYNETMIEIDNTKPIDGSDLLDKIDGK